MINLTSDIDRIIQSTTDNKFINGNDLNDLITFVATTIYQYEKNHSLIELKKIVFNYVLDNYQQFYVKNSQDIISKVEKVESDITVPDQLRLPNADADMEYFDSAELEELLSEKPKKKFSVLNSDNRSPTDSDTERGDKVSLNNCMDLVSHYHDYPHAEYKEQIYIRRRNLVTEIKNIPQAEQKSAEWFAQRNECLTATAIATALNEDPYKYPISSIIDKCGRSPPFEENENVHHGKKYELIANMYYAFRYNINVAEYGLLQHPKNKIHRSKSVMVFVKKVLITVHHFRN